MAKFNPEDRTIIMLAITKKMKREFKEVCHNQCLEMSFVLREFVRNYIEDRRKAEKDYDAYNLPTKDMYDTGEENVSFNER